MFVDFADLITQHKTNSKKTWQIIKEVIGKTEIKKDKLSKKISVNGIDEYDKDTIYSSRQFQ